MLIPNSLPKEHKPDRIINVLTKEGKKGQPSVHEKGLLRIIWSWRVLDHVPKDFTQLLWSPNEGTADASYKVIWVARKYIISLQDTQLPAGRLDKTVWEERVAKEYNEWKEKNKQGVEEKRYRAEDFPPFVEKDDVEVADPVAFAEADHIMSEEELAAWQGDFCKQNRPTDPALISEEYANPDHFWDEYMPPMEFFASNQQYEGMGPVLPEFDVTGTLEYDEDWMNQAELSTRRRVFIQITRTGADFCT